MARIDNDDESNEYVHGDNDEEAEENEIDEDSKAKTKKPVKKSVGTPKSSRQTKLAFATATDKNNATILNFFQKSQKRPLNETKSCTEIASLFLLNRKLKICTHF